MAEQVLTEVRATVDRASEGRLVAGFLELLKSPVPDGLLRTELLRGPDRQWRIETLWRDRAALDVMRAGAEPPAAPSSSAALVPNPPFRSGTLCPTTPKTPRPDRRSGASGEPPMLGSPSASAPD